MPHLLKKAAIKGMLWSIIGGIASRGIRLIIGVILARLLAPEMFGLIAMLLVFITFGEIFIDSGFGTALIQKQNVTELEICSVFYLNILIGVIAAALLFFSAPIISAFYGYPILISLTRALSPIFILDSFGMIQSNLLLKRINFKSLAKIHAISSSISGIVGISLAFLGCGVWSLVIQRVLSSMIRNFLFWFNSTWRPKLLFSFNALGIMLKFGLPMLCTGIMNRTYESVYYMIIGKLFSASDLGLFSRANQLQGFFASLLSTFIGGALFPILSKVQNDPIIFKSGLRKTLIIIASVIFPIMIGLAVVARPLILFLLTDKWAGTIIYLQLLTVVGILSPLEWLRLRAIQALGKPELSLRVEIIQKALLFTSIAVMWYWGILGIIFGMIFASLFSFCLAIYYIAIVTQYSIKEQFRDIMPMFIISVIMGVVAYSVLHLLNDLGSFSQLVISSFTGFLFYIGTNWIFRTSASTTIIREIREFGYK